MSTVIGLFLRQPDVVTLLHAELGAHRSWRDFLADCIRDRADYRGLQLLPDRYLRARCQRPVYRVEDVEDFIEKALKIAPRKAIEVLEIKIEPTAHFIPARWRHTAPGSIVTAR